MRKQLVGLIFIINTFWINGQIDYKNKMTIPISEYKDSLESIMGLNVFQIINGDSIVLTDRWEYFWATIKIYHKNILIFEYEQNLDNLLYELFVFENEICKISNDLYIFRIERRPDVCSSFLVFKRNKDKFKLIGETEESSAFIFGDIDSDNKLEIGGFTYLFESEIDSYGPRNITYTDRFRIYKISDTIVRDIALEKKFAQVIMARFDFPHSGCAQSFVITEPIKDSMITINSMRKYAGLSYYKLWNGSLDGISKSELRLMRNEIYAYHGYIFNSMDLADYFSKQTWYKPCCVNVDDRLTDIEKYNIQFIKEKENY